MTGPSTQDDDAQLLSLLANLQLDHQHLRRALPPSTRPHLPPIPATLSPNFGHEALHQSLQFLQAPLSINIILRLVVESHRTVARSLAGNATQGVPGGHVQALHNSRKKKPRSKKAAYVVFCGRRCGVFYTWAETQALASGVCNCIFRGYASTVEAHNAFAFAQVRGWTHVTDNTFASPISVLPQPLDSPDDGANSLNAHEPLDDRWYIVYRGITPGLYRSQ
ncbi:hypothetical protein B0H17DRAFT_1208317 [Mycena rosella]|uniref:Ribonuclease H1 N-terminal domain-containing protein n=1 Tax=Mycena rosella TaxID=1033263 RepID=A0AAD7D143_MYCRO|nr:hypothetical protein B0H17DRAFT_1208317 [Mycena rosella]